MSESQKDAAAKLSITIIRVNSTGEVDKFYDVIASGDREHFEVCANSYYIWLDGGQYACKYWNIAFNKITYASLYNLEEGISSKTLLEQFLA